jgi:hypothetical protein
MAESHSVSEKEGRMSKFLRDVTDLVDLFWRGLIFMLSWHAIFMAMLTVLAIFLSSEKVGNQCDNVCM